MNKYYSRSLVRKGILSMPQLLVDHDQMGGLPATWHPVYQDVITNLYATPPSEEKEDEASPADKMS